MTNTANIPFSMGQLLFFEKELKQAGSFEKLMLKKKALHHDGTLIISLYKNKEEYKVLFLTGLYEDLRQHYDTEVPYLFWGRMFEALEKMNEKE